MASLSIVIPSKTRADLLMRCLASVNQHSPPGTQVIVVDDASKNAVVSKTAAKFPNVVIIHRERSDGFCAAANSGIAAATAEIVELLNDDAEVSADWWKTPLRLFADADVAAVTPLVLRNQPGPLRIDSAGDDYDAGGFARKRHHNQPYRELPACEVNAVSACAAFYRREALLQAGGFPAHFQAYFDDVDLSLRLRANGGRLLFEPSSVVWHRVSASYGKKPTRRLIELQSRNEEWLYLRNAKGWGTLPRHLAVLAAKAGRRMEEGMLGPWLAGRLRAVCAFNRI